MEFTCKVPSCRAPAIACQYEVLAKLKHVDSQPTNDPRWNWSEVISDMRYPTPNPDPLLSGPEPVISLAYPLPHLYLSGMRLVNHIASARHSWLRPCQMFSGVGLLVTRTCLTVLYLVSAYQLLRVDARGF